MKQQVCHLKHLESVPRWHAKMAHQDDVVLGWTGLECQGVPRTAPPQVLYKYGRTSAEKLKGMDAHVTFKTFPGMAHSACPAELAEVQAFLAKVLPKQ